MSFNRPPKVDAQLQGLDTHQDALASLKAGDVILLRRSDDELTCTTRDGALVGAVPQDAAGRLQGGTFSGIVRTIRRQPPPDNATTQILVRFTPGDPPPLLQGAPATAPRAASSSGVAHGPPPPCRPCRAERADQPPQETATPCHPTAPISHKLAGRPSAGDGGADDMARLSQEQLERLGGQGRWLPLLSQAANCLWAAGCACVHLLV